MTSISPAPDRVAGVARRTPVTATFSERVRSGSLNTNTVRLVKGGTTALIPATVSYNATTRKVTLTPSAPLDPNTTYIATVTTGVRGTWRATAWTRTRAPRACKARSGASGRGPASSYSAS